jgi:glycosyltransferase involved in cell wall biosynthesis
VTARRCHRILVATNMFPHDEDPARGSFVKAQVDALREIGALVDVLHIRGDHSTLNYAKAVFTIRRAVRQFRADVVYAFYGLTGWVALWQPKPVVLSLAGDDVLGTPNGRGRITFKSRLGVALTQWAAHRAAVVCVQSEEMQRKLWGRNLQDRALIVPFGVDPMRFHPGDQAAARLRLGLPPDDLLVIFPNTPTEPRKRLDLAQAAITIAQRSLPRVRLQVVSRVPHAEMPYYYRAADCCLLTSDWEGSPNVVKEALLSGLPVVTTDVGDVRQWVKLSPESAICDRTPESVSSALLGVLRESRRVDPAPFVASFSSSAIAKRMMSLFDRLISRAPEIAS